MSSPKTFRDFNLDASICDSLEDAGITEPFPIQEMTLPLALQGADIIGQARTGTGKTLGFGLPMLQRIDMSGALQVLIIVPTRELCLQVAEDLMQAGKGRGVEVLAVYGGKAIQPQIDALAAGVHMVVGTPGRLLDLSRRGVMDLSHCRGLVLDEADEMLDLGFLPDVEALVDMCDTDRQTLLFSATMPAEIVGLARRYMTKPTFMRAEVEEITIAPETKQYFFSCHRMDKPAVVARILQSPKRGLCVVFCRTKRMADTLAEELRDRDIEAKAIHSDLRQDARERALSKFREGKITVLCATEVAARGLDIDDVTHVVNYDCPDDHKMYLHRIGRTGRAGADGVAITFATWNEIPRLEMIRRDLDIQEEIIEIFSTSPQLTELFDLPALEEKKKVPSPVQARRGAQSRRRESLNKNDSGTSDRKSQSSHSKSRDDNAGDASHTDDSRSTKPTRTPEKVEAATQSRDKGAKERDRDRAAEPRSRTRTRRRTKTIAPEVDGTPSSMDDADDSSEQRSDRGSRGTPSDDGGRGQRTSDGERSRKKASDTRSHKLESDRTSDDDNDRGAARSEADKSGEDHRGRADNRGRSRSSGQDKKRGRGSGGRNGSSNVSNSNGRNSNGGRSDGGRSDGGTASDGSRTRHPDSDRQQRRRTVIDAATARGEGQPRLTRKMDVQHLP